VGSSRGTSIPPPPIIRGLSLFARLTSSAPCTQIDDRKKEKDKLTKELNEVRPLLSYTEKKRFLVLSRRADVVSQHDLWKSAYRLQEGVHKTQRQVGRAYTYANFLST
jgi:hypothetical protein